MVKLERQDEQPNRMQFSTIYDAFDKCTASLQTQLEEARNRFQVKTVKNGDIFPKSNAN